MKKILLVALASGWASWSAQAGAIGGFGGTIDTADFGEGTSVGAKLEADLFGPVAIELRGSYSYDFDQEELGLDDFVLYGAEAGLRIRVPLGKYLSLHAGAGGGYFVMPEFDVTLEDGTVMSSDIDDAPGVYGLGGMEMGSENFRIFAEAKYLFLRPELVETDFLENHFTPIDTDLSGVSLLAGVLVRW